MKKQLTAANRRSIFSYDIVTGGGAEKKRGERFKVRHMSRARRYTICTGDTIIILLLYIVRN